MRFHAQTTSLLVSGVTHMVLVHFTDPRPHETVPDPVCCFQLKKNNTVLDLVCRLLLEKKKKKKQDKNK